jgi:hypothetical protein
MHLVQEHKSIRIDQQTTKVGNPPRVFAREIESSSHVAVSLQQVGRSAYLARKEEQVIFVTLCQDLFDTSSLFVILLLRRPVLSIRQRHSTTVTFSLHMGQQTQANICISWVSSLVGGLLLPFPIAAFPPVLAVMINEFQC